MCNKNDTFRGFKVNKAKSEGHDLIDTENSKEVSTNVKGNFVKPSKRNKTPKRKPSLKL